MPVVDRFGGEADLGWVVVGGGGQACGGVFAFEDEALAEDLVSPGV